MVVAFVGSRRIEQRVLRSDFEPSSKIRASAFRREIDSNLAALTMLRGFTELSPQVTQKAFEQFSTRTHAAIRSIGVTDSETVNLVGESQSSWGESWLGSFWTEEREPQKANRMARDADLDRHPTKCGTLPLFVSSGWRQLLCSCVLCGLRRATRPGWRS